MNLDIAAALCERFEGFKAKPYLCPAGIPTIGLGSTYYPGGIRVTLADPEVTLTQARAMLMHELLFTFAPGVLRLCPGLLVLAASQGDWGKLNAVVDFAYNLGIGRLQTSTLRRKINSADWRGCVEELNKWVMGGGKKLPGLVFRRAAESVYFR